MYMLWFAYFLSLLAYRPCYSTEFPCRNSECLPNGMLCDGVANCMDGSDEDHCSKYIHLISSVSYMST